MTAAQLASLQAMSSSSLRERWETMVATPAPKISAKMLRLALAWEIQARAHGGLTPGATRVLDQLQGSRPAARGPSAGVQLVREWAGQIHVVTIDDNKVIRWDEREWRSLSAVARAITGTRWSGPAFFGLTKKVEAA